LLLLRFLTRWGERGLDDDGDFFTDFVVFRSCGGAERWATMATFLPLIICCLPLTKRKGFQIPHAQQSLKFPDEKVNDDDNKHVF